MSWIASIVIGLLTAVVGAFGAGYVANAAVSWYRIPSREGASGYFVVFMALLGLIGGLIVGIVVARVVAAGSAPSFAKGLGLALLTAIGLTAAGGGLAWLGADLPPTLDGKQLELVLEVRCPVTFAMPKPNDGRQFYVTLYASRDNRSSRMGTLHCEQATRVDGRWILPGTVDVHTSAANKMLGVQLGEAPSQYFELPLAAKPGSESMTWSAWLEPSYLGDLSQPASDAAIAVRYRVQFATVPPPPLR